MAASCGAVFLSWHQRQGMMQSQGSAFGLNSAIISVLPETKPASVSLSKSTLKLLLTETAPGTKLHWSLTKDAVWGFLIIFSSKPGNYLGKKTNQNKTFYWKASLPSSVRLEYNTVMDFFSPQILLVYGQHTATHLGWEERQKCRIPLENLSVVYNTQQFVNKLWEQICFLWHSAHTQILRPG